jgi:hypothetical protein
MLHYFTAERIVSRTQLPGTNNAPRRAVNETVKPQAEWCESYGDHAAAEAGLRKTQTKSILLAGLDCRQLETARQHPTVVTREAKPGRRLLVPVAAITRAAAEG